MANFSLGMVRMSAATWNTTERKGSDTHTSGVSLPVSLRQAGGGREPASTNRSFRRRLRDARCASSSPDPTCGAAAGGGARARGGAVSAKKTACATRHPTSHPAPSLLPTPPQTNQDDRSPASQPPPQKKPRKACTTTTTAQHTTRPAEGDEPRRRPIALAPRRPRLRKPHEPLAHQAAPAAGAVPPAQHRAVKLAGLDIVRLDLEPGGGAVVGDPGRVQGLDQDALLLEPGGLRGGGDEGFGEGFVVLFLGEGKMGWCIRREGEGSEGRRGLRRGVCVLPKAAPERRRRRSGPSARCWRAARARGRARRATPMQRRRENKNARTGPWIGGLTAANAWSMSSLPAAVLEARVPPKRVSSGSSGTRRPHTRAAPPSGVLPSRTAPRSSAWRACSGRCMQEELSRYKMSKAT